MGGGLAEGWDALGIWELGGKLADERLVREVEVGSALILMEDALLVRVLGKTWEAVGALKSSSPSEAHNSLSSLSMASSI